MGSFVFKWDHPADEVYVTGTFDNWEKSEKLVKNGNSFSKDVKLNSAADKIYYKFVVDGNWVTDHTAPQENDASGNLNNVLTTDRIIKHTPETAGIMSGVTPTSTTAALAKNVPLENEKAPLQNTGSADLPGAFPETPAAVEKGDFSVSPLPAADGAVNPIKLAPGEPVPPPSTFTNNTITSGVHDDPELVAADLAKTESESKVSVNPLPGFAGAVNPAPGTVNRSTIESGVTLDKESYEKNGGIGNVPVLPPVVTPDATRALNGTGILDMPSAKNLIPESSLPMGTSGLGAYDATPTIQSAGPTSTTSALAAGVPLESAKVPEIVKESQEKAHFDPEASANPEEVKEKSAVEKELLKEVPVAPSTSEGTAGKGTDKSEKTVSAGEAAAAIGGAAVAVGGVAAAYASGAASNAASKLPESVTSKLPASIQNSITSMNAQADSTPKEAARDTPAIVKESIAQSGQAPEAAANEEAVLEKKAVEKELLSEIKPETSTGDSAPKLTSTNAQSNSTSKEVAKDTPLIVKESIAQSGRAPEAAANEEAVLEKKAVEKELLSEVKPETSTGESAPKSTSAVVEPTETKAAALTASKSASPRTESRDVSPGTVPGSHGTESQTAPVITTGVASTETDKNSYATPSTPAKNTVSPPAAVSTPAKETVSTPAKTTTPAGPSTPAQTTPGSSNASPASAAADKKKKRTSIFGKIKAKLSHKD
ncbi:related to cell wall mannoprotein [Rhynchosporium agropyri]|uniref:Related to cell wall mannoprotein n=1 Tax=Rhynchosporium agropyri TaxID=914238 RepID=A0A1E1JWZ6_9HELO|nr:related to cell wall mannoprotein [Rhynchosporium agropyri]